MTTMERRVSFIVGPGEFSRVVIGETSYGDEYVLLDHDDNLLTNAAWESNGFAVAQLFDRASDYAALQESTRAIVQRVMTGAGVPTPSAFRIEDYHTFVDEKTHDAVARRIQNGFPLDVLPFPVDLIEKRVSAILGTPVRCRHKKTDAERKFNLRIVRPPTTTTRRIATSGSITCGTP
jgi:hypothetical protein